tara:strand:- start:240 stop:1088 length:849 start_codon:yes stop_codon:yes gene_type:complete
MGAGLPSDGACNGNIDMESVLDDVEPLLLERSLGDILNETFVIYGRHFAKFLGLAGAVQIPATLILLAPIENAAIYIILNLISLIALVSIFGATIYAVGQHYLTDSVTVVDCYRRLIWRLVSMAILAAIFAVITIMGLLLLSFVGVTLYSFAVATMLILGAYIVPALVGPVVIIEGVKTIAALQRAFELARQNVMRMSWDLLVFFLVAFGLGFVLFTPFILFFPSETDALSRTLVVVSLIAPAVVVPPVLSIAITLLYYDLRVRNEGFNIEKLSQEMGLAAV